MRVRGSLRPWIALLALAGTAIGCTGGPSTDKVNVVTSTTVFADLIANVGGDYVSVSSMVPKNGDVHTFEARPADIRAVAQARLIVMNGMGLDDWLARTISNAAAEGTPLIELGPNVRDVELLPGEVAGTQNPHLFMDPKYAERYVDQIAAGLQSVDPAHASAYVSQAAAYKQKLQDLDVWIRSEISTVPEENRRIVTFHDAFPYYAREYGITIVGVAVEAPGQEPSAGYTAELVGAIKANGVKAIFSEAQFPANIVRQLGDETGCKVVSNLYDDSLGDPPVTSYIEVIRWDTTQLAEALR